MSRTMYLTGSCGKISLSIGLLFGASFLVPFQVSAQSPEYYSALNAMRARPSNPETSFQFAQIASSEGDLSGAIAALERVLTLYPQLSNIKLELGVLYLETGATQLGEEYIRDALRSPDVPPDVRVRAEAYLDEAETQNSRFRVSGDFEVGLTSNSNANSAPSAADAGLGLEGLTVATGEPDTSAYVFGQVELRYDLGFQAGHELALDGTLYSERYQDLAFLDFDRFAVSTGIDFNLSQAIGRPAQLQLRYAGDVAYRNQEKYLTESGPSIVFRYFPDDRSDIRMSAFSRHQDFDPNVSTDLRDGPFRGLSLRAERALSPRVTVRGGLLFAQKEAEVAYEAYDQFVASLGIDRAFDAPRDNWEGPWVVGLSGYYSKTKYDADDPYLTGIGLAPVGGRGDIETSISGTLEIPINDTFGVLTEIGYTRQDSDIDLFDYENRFASVGLTYNF